MGSDDEEELGAPPARTPRGKGRSAATTAAAADVGDEDEDALFLDELGSDLDGDVEEDDEEEGDEEGENHR